MCIHYTKNISLFAICTNELNLGLGLLMNKIQTLWVFRLQLVAHLFLFYFVAWRSNNTLYTFETSSIFCDEIVRLRKTQYLLDAKKPSHLIDYIYLQTIGIFISLSDCRENKCFPNTVGEFKIRHLYSVILQYRLGIWSTGVANKCKTIQRLSFAYDVSGMRSQQ